MPKKHGKGFWDDLDLFGDKAAQKKAEEAAREAERLKNRHWSEKGMDLLGDAAAAAIPHLTRAIFGNGTSGGAKGDQRRFLANRAVPNRVPNSVRVREMRDVKDYNRNQQQRVFDMEKRQVQSEQESIKPIDAKDAGAAFKLQSYISKLQQVLSAKADIFSQLAASPFTDLSQLKGTSKQAGLLTMMTSKSELVQAFNEMVAYVSLFFKDIQLDNRVRDKMYAAYFSPLIDQMRQLAAQYPPVFERLPEPERGPRDFETRGEKVYDLARKELRDMYSLLNVAADNIQAGIFRPIGPKDVVEYTRDNKINEIFSANPPPPGPVIPSPAVQQATQQVQVSEANARAAQARAAEIAEQDPYDPMGDASLSPQQQQAYSRVQALIRQSGENPGLLINADTVDNLLDAYARRRITDEQLNMVITTQYAVGKALNPLLRPMEQLNTEQARTQMRQIQPQIVLYNDWVQSRGMLAPPGEQPEEMPVEAEEGGEPERRPAELEIATDEEIAEAIAEFVETSGYPNDLKLPKQDSGNDEVGLSSGARWRPLFNIANLLRESGLRPASQKAIARVISEYNSTKEARKPGRKPKTPSGEAVRRRVEEIEGREEPGGAVRPQRFQSPPAPPSRPAGEAQQQEGELGGEGMSGGRLRSHQNLRGRSGRELEFVPAKALNSAAPPFQMGYGSHHRPKFAWEMEQEAAGPRYVRQDRAIYNLNGGLGMVNPDNEIGAYQVLRMAGEVGRGMSGGVYLPKEYVVQPAGEKEFFGYGVDGDNDVFGELGGYGSLKKRLAGGMINPFAVSKDYHYKPVADGYDDAEDFAYGAHEEPVEASQQAHEEEEEKPVDLDENPNPFRVRNENYKVNTGKMKKVSYKMPNM